MMMITNEGHNTFFKAIVGSLDSVHLMTDQGELTGYNYKPKKLTASAWSMSGRYPEQAWVFTAGDKVQVKGYYVTNAEGKIMFSDEFDITDEDDFVIQHDGSKIKVNIELSLLAAEG